ncbi:hypothetical protein ZEAMMB73_Zm00001d038681 [Zea mays]|uniref:Uncharacterized protein n=1 Tax=Zea mays TaxID=4577 RepID=A0A1D6M9Q9_MAIZE|nr:hypothetical protein ZEAMMB73_Zm00001d038681 [Zea mays]
MDNVESAPDSPAQAPPSSASSLPKEQSQVELELRLLQALEFYPPSKLKGVHRHFVLYGLMEYLRKSLDRQFSSDEVLQLLDRFFNLEMLVLWVSSGREIRRLVLSDSLFLVALSSGTSAAGRH